MNASVCAWEINTDGDWIRTACDDVLRADLHDSAIECPKCKRPVQRAPFVYPADYPAA